MSNKAALLAAAAWMSIAIIYSAASYAAARPDDIFPRTASPEAVEVALTGDNGETDVARLVRVVGRHPESGTVDLQVVTTASLARGYWDLGELNAGPIVSIRISNPLTASVSFGWVIGDIESLNNGFSAERMGALFEGEIGLGGAKGSIGVISERFLLVLPMGFDVKASVLRTWWMSLGAAPGQTYAGGELDAYFMGLKLSFGLFKQLGAENLIVSGGVGLGF